MVAVLVRGFVVRVTLTLAVVFLVVDFLGAASAFDFELMGRVAMTTGVSEFLVSPAEVVGFLVPVLPLVAAGLAALGLVLTVGFLAADMVVSIKMRAYL